MDYFLPFVLLVAECWVGAVIVLFSSLLVFVQVFRRQKGQRLMMGNVPVEEQEE
jgi:hypothetical protein